MKPVGPNQKYPHFKTQSQYVFGKFDRDFIWTQKSHGLITTGKGITYSNVCYD